MSSETQFHEDNNNNNNFSADGDSGEFPSLFTVPEESIHFANEEQRNLELELLVMRDLKKELLSKDVTEKEHVSLKHFASNFETFFASYFKGNFLDCLTWKKDESKAVLCQFFNNVKKLQDIQTPEQLQEQYSQLRKNIYSFVFDGDKDGKDEREFLVMSCGATLLNIFVQANFTGPPTTDNIPQTPFDIAFQEEFISEEKRKMLNQYAIDKLSISGEIAYNLTSLPHYLLCATIFFEFHDIHLPTYYWWKARCSLIHNQILSHSVETLYSNAVKSLKLIEELITELTVLNGEIGARFYVERALVEHNFLNSKFSSKFLDKATQCTGMTLSLTGYLGTRTKYQTEKKAQLTLLAHSKSDDVVETKDEELKSNQQLPSEVQLSEDSILLEKPSLDEYKITNLRLIDQVIILALCLDIKNTNPEHGLTVEEMLPYVQRVIDNGKSNWMIYSAALFIKSRLEADRSKTVERSVFQLQVLVDQFNEKEPPASERLQFFYSLHFPPVFNLKRELGLRFLKLGAAKSALQLFEALQMWEDIVTCYVIVEKEKSALRIIEERLKVDENNAMMWCLKGDITENREFYEKAWLVSKCRLARAKRSLGNSYFKEGKFKESIEHFETALNLSPYYSNTWFVYGCAAIRAQEWKKALNAFTRVVQLDPEDAESWCNISSIYQTLGEKRKSFVSMQEALKHCHHNWRLWENFLYTSAELGEYQHAIFAFNKVIENRSDKEFDIRVLAALVKTTLNLLNKSPNEGAILKKRLDELFENITSKITFNPAMWDIYAFYFEGLQDLPKAIEMRQKHVRMLQTAGWEKDEQRFNMVSSGVLQLAQLQIKYCENLTEESSETQRKLLLNDALMILRPIIKRTEELWSQTKTHKLLREQLDKVSSLL